MFAGPLIISLIVLVVVVLLLRVIFRSFRRNGAPFGLFMLVAFLAIMMLAARRYTHRAPAPVERHTAAMSLQVRLPGTRPATQTSKLWIDDWTAYTNSGRVTSIRSESSDTATTVSESMEEAIRAGARQLYAKIRTRPELRDRQGLSRISDNDVRQQLAEAITAQQLLIEQHVQRTEKSYGTLWKTYLLIDASPQKLNPIVHQIGRRFAAERRVALTTAGSVAATMLVVFLLYAFLNTVTKGYFVWRLRAAVILVLIAGVLVCFSGM